MFLNKDLVFLITMYSFNIVLYFISFVWIMILEKSDCECSKNWKRIFIKYFLFSMIIYLIISCIYTLLRKNHHINFHRINQIFYILEIIYLVIMFLYIKHLIKKRCHCVKIKEHDITNIFLKTDLILFFLSFILLICYIIFKFLG